MTILVTGATANVGRLVVDHLLRAGATDVRALTARPDLAALPVEIDVRRGFLGRLDSLAPALEGVDSLYLAPHPPSAERVVALAAQAGVRRIVDLAGAPGTWWHSIEGAVEASGLAWTHLEPGEFMLNATAWAEQIRATGQVRDGYPNSANAPIDLDDVAAVAATALLRHGHEGRSYELTGPQTLTRAQMVAQIGEALGQEVPYVELTHEEAVAEKTSAMGEYARWYVEGMALLAEHPQQATATVEQVTGRPATTFATWAEANVELFR